MSPIQEESQDRDQHIPSNLKVKAVQSSLDECNEHGTGRCSEANSGSTFTTLVVASLCFVETRVEGHRISIELAFMVNRVEGLPFRHLIPEEFLRQSCTTDIIRMAITWNSVLLISKEECLGVCTASPGVQPSEKKGGMEGGLDTGDVPSEQGTGKNNRNKEELQNLDLEDVTRSLILRQIREFNYVHADLSLMSLLKVCLETGHRGRSSIVALSSYIEHFESRLEEDLGWGCGWRNIQMLSSYVIAQNIECKDALFGGAGFVPDIPAMQQWLEIAWLKGFDVLGADYFDWKISGTHKWIGTTECAALLRSFGVRARVVDFRTAGSKRGMDMVSKVGGLKGGGSHLDPPVNQDDTDEISGNFNQMTVSGGHSPRRTTTDPTTENNSPSEENPSSPTSDPNDASREESPVIVLSDQKEELHFLRQSPEDPNICLTCVEERKHNISASQLHALIGEEKFVHSGDSSAITGAQRHAYSSAGGGGGVNSADVPLNHKYMIDWIWNYFSADIGHSEGSSNFSNRSPLYFQHRGHSRTIVGIERCKKEGSNKEEDYLIVLDPSQRTQNIITALQRKQGWEELLKRGMHTLNQAEYQLCYIDPGIAKGDELESLKTLSSVRYMY